MPLYTYRREDGSTFDIKQSFSDDALTQDPATGQKVVRLVQRPGVIFKGSGFYVTDSKGASKSSVVSGSKESKDSEATKPATEVSESKPAEATKPASTATASAPSATAAAD
jgi:predicted nucleic acid-binding Zn ribbon protein